MPQVTSIRYEDPAIWVYDTLADMRLDTDPGANYALAVLTGGADAFDVTPSGLYAWNASSTTADNGTTVIKQTNTTTGRWIRLAS